MRIALNLATRPFTDLGPATQAPAHRHRLSSPRSVCSSWLGLHLFDRQAAAGPRPRALARRPDRAHPGRAPARPGLHAPARQRASSSTQAEFLNQLFDEKAFSWTLAMEAMETVLPAGVQVTAIEPHARQGRPHQCRTARRRPPRSPSIWSATWSARADSCCRASSAKPPRPRNSPNSAPGPRQRLQPLRLRSARRLQSAHRRKSARPPRPKKSAADAAVDPSPAPVARPAALPCRRLPCAMAARPTPAPPRPRPSPALHGHNRAARRSAMSAIASLRAWRERLASPLTWHIAGFVVLLVLAVVLAIRLGIDWAAMDSHSTEVLAGKQVQLKALEIANRSLARPRQARRRKPASRCRLLPEAHPAQLLLHRCRASASLQVASGVRLSRVQYTQGAPGSDLTEISMDAGISGDYPAIMRFVNSIERDQTVFHHPRHGPHRPAGRPRQSAPARLHLAAPRRCRGQRTASTHAR